MTGEIPTAGWNMFHSRLGFFHLKQMQDLLFCPTVGIERIPALRLTIFPIECLIHCTHDATALGTRVDIICPF